MPGIPEMSFGIPAAAAAPKDSEKDLTVEEKLETTGEKLVAEAPATPATPAATLATEEEDEEAEEGAELAMGVATRPVEEVELEMGGTMLLVLFVPEIAKI